MTDFADQAVMLPLAGLVAVALAVSGWWRGLFAWLAATLGVLGTVAVLKYAFFTCAAPLGETGIVSPSGHTAAAAAIYGGGLVLLLRGRLPWLALVAIPPLFAVVFGISRVWIGVHTIPDVLVGGAVGVAGAAALAALAGPWPGGRMWPGAVAACAVVIACHGLRLHAEGLIHHFVLFTWLPLPAVCRA